MELQKPKPSVEATSDLDRAAQDYNQNLVAYYERVLKAIATIDYAAEGIGPSVLQRMARVALAPVESK